MNWIDIKEHKPPQHPQSRNGLSIDVDVLYEGEVKTGWLYNCRDGNFVLLKPELQHKITHWSPTSLQQITAPDRLPHPCSGEQNESAAGGG